MLGSNTGASVKCTLLHYLMYMLSINIFLIQIGAEHRNSNNSQMLQILLKHYEIYVYQLSSIYVYTKYLTACAIAPIMNMHMLGMIVLYYKKIKNRAK